MFIWSKLNLKKNYTFYTLIIMNNYNYFVYYRALVGGNMKFVTTNIYDKCTKKKGNQMKRFF